MKTRTLVTLLAALAVPLLALWMLCSAAPVSAEVQTPPDSPIEWETETGVLGVTTVYTSYCLVISNEPYGYLVDTLIALGHVDETLFELLTNLMPQSNGVITAYFYNQVAAASAGAEVFHATLENYAGLQGGIAICDDGTLGIPSLEGQAYVSLPGYALAPGLDGVFQSTYALDPSDYIYTATSEYGGGITAVYYTFAIVWRAPRAIFLPVVLK